MRDGGIELTDDAIPESILRTWQRSDVRHQPDEFIQEILRLPRKDYPGEHLKRVFVLEEPSQEPQDSSGLSQILSRYIMVRGRPILWPDSVVLKPGPPGVRDPGNLHRARAPNIIWSIGCSRIEFHLSIADGGACAKSLLQDLHSNNIHMVGVAEPDRLGTLCELGLVLRKTSLRVTVEDHSVYKAVEREEVVVWERLGHCELTLVGVQVVVSKPVDRYVVG